ncbi:MAG: tetratricopeptide repeat protein [Xanthobacteraceae bacterium]
MTALNTLRRLAGTLSTALVLLAPQTAAADVPTPHELAQLTPYGAYLAARHAGMERDAAAAAAYYRAALRADPSNKDLLERSFLALLASGDVEDAVRLAGPIVQADSGDRIARLVLGVNAIKQKRYPAARQHLAQSVRGPITDLAATLLSAWASYGANDVRGAIGGIDRLSGPDWYGLFKDQHAGLILDLAGKQKDANKRFERAYKLDPSELRLAEGYAISSARIGDRNEALKIIEAYQQLSPRQPLIAALKDRITAIEPVLEPALLRPGSRGDDVKRLQDALGIGADGVFGPRTEKAVRDLQRKNDLRVDGVAGPQTLAKLGLFKGQDLPPMVASPAQGAAEVLYGMGAWIARRGGEDLGLVYLQLALYLEPQHPLALIALADLYTSVKKPEIAIKLYDRVPETTPMRRNADIQLALNLDSLDRTEEAQKRLDKLIAEQPKDADAILALGNILRGRKKFAECADAYSKAVATVETAQRTHWLLFYFRGICYERAKKWDKAEPDLKKALELFPDQPQVLNYLGYSWIDQGINLDEGLRMIRRAVEQRPEDGYIIDSLGWAYYRLANYEEAAKQLERAVELKPEDPTINDHLGDAYWRIGRRLEAKFQWSHAKDLKPEPEDLPKIEEKLKSGLSPETSSAAEAEKMKKSRSGG